MSARLPIYRSLNHRLEILGFSLLELGVLTGLFLVLSNVLSFTKLHSLLAGLLVVFLGAFIRHLNRRFERRFTLRLVRFCMLPAKLHRRLTSSTGLRLSSKAPSNTHKEVSI